MDSRSVTIAPLSAAGGDGALDHPASLAQAPTPCSRAGSPAHRSRSPIYVFTLPILAFTMSDLGVHVAPIHVFTFDRSGRSRCAGTRTMTDADLVLGYLNPDYFLGGRMRLDRG